MKRLHFAIVLMLIISACTPAKKNIIHKGDWKINDAVIYDFPKKQIVDFDFLPSLTVGSNGVMLYVQLANGKTGATLPVGADLSIKVNEGSAVLSILNSPDKGALGNVMDVPYAIWYIEPPSKEVSGFEISYHGQTQSWQFSQGKKTSL